MKSILICLIMSISSVSFAGDLAATLSELKDLAQFEANCLDNEMNQSTYGMLMCMGNRYDAMDVILNREYKEIMKDIEGEEKSRLIQSQRDWLKFRVSNCYWEATSMLGGTGENVIYLGCMNQMTNERIEALVKFYYTQY